MLSAFGQLSGVKGASGLMEYAKFNKPDWQQVDTGGDIRFVNKNSPNVPLSIPKSASPELNFQRQKFGAEYRQQLQNSTRGREADLRSEFAGLQTSKDWWAVQPVIQTAREAAKTDNKSADLNLIYATAKLYDPGSVVREGETSMQVKQGSPAEQFQGLWHSVVGGGRLTPEVRAKLMEQIESRARGYEDAYNTRANQYMGIANRYGIDPQNIVTTTPNTAVRAASSSTVSESPSAQFRITVNGKPYIFPSQKALANFKLKLGIRNGD